MSEVGAEGMRLDKWLWVARFFKSRRLAAEAVQGGKVHLNNGRVKPSHKVQIGDRMRIQHGSERYEVTVLGLASQRRPACEVQALYAEPEASRQKREALREQRRLQRQVEPVLTHHPSKRERRLIYRLRHGGD